jgi:hypothetical protein
MDLLTISSVMALSFALALGGTRGILGLMLSCMARATTINRR